MDVYFDGGLQDGVLRTCVVANDEPAIIEWPDAARRTSGHAEWLAAREAVRLLDERPALAAELIGDYENVIRHFNAGRPDAARCRHPENLRIAVEIEHALVCLNAKGWCILWRSVDRARNLAGHALEGLPPA